MAGLLDSAVVVAVEVGEEHDVSGDCSRLRFLSVGSFCSTGDDTDLAGSGVQSCLDGLEGSLGFEGLPRFLAGLQVCCVDTVFGAADFVASVLAR